MIVFLTIIHVLICLVVIISVLLQSSKGGGLAGMFGGGGGGMGNVFGGRGASTFLSKVTTWAGLSLAGTSLIIALLTSGTSSSQKSLIQQDAEQQQTQSTPAAMLPSINPGIEGEQTQGAAEATQQPSKEEEAK